MKTLLAMLLIAYGTARVVDVVQDGFTPGSDANGHFAHTVGLTDLTNTTSPAQSPGAIAEFPGNTQLYHRQLAYHRPVSDSLAGVGSGYRMVHHSSDRRVDLP